MKKLLILLFCLPTLGMAQKTFMPDDIFEMFKRNFLLSFLLLSLSSCGMILHHIYGVNILNEFNHNHYDNFIIKTPTKCVSIVSSANQYKEVIELGLDKIQKKDLVQPIQLMYFNNNSLNSYHINCYAKGRFSNLDWNTDNRFNYFPPKTAVNVKGIQIDLEKIRAIYPSTASCIGKNTIVIFWTLMLEKQSRGAIDIVIQNLEDNKKMEVTNIILINTDKYYIDIGLEN
jgi:hypothetical protein